MFGMLELLFIICCICNMSEFVQRFNISNIQFQARLFSMFKTINHVEDVGQYDYINSVSLNLERVEYFD